MKARQRQTQTPSLKASLKTKLLVAGATLILVAVGGIFLFFYLNLGVSHQAVAAPVNISGVINSYLRVTGISGTTFTTDNLSGSISDFAAGKTVMVYQAQGVSMSNGNNASYGNITAYNNGGNYELATVSSISGSGPYTITMSSLSRAYTASAAVQLVSVPTYTDVNVSGTLTATAWSASLGRGGILALQVSNDLTLGANVTVAGLGFAGGAAGGSDGSCPDNTTYKTSNSDYGAKGSGISTEGSLYGRGAQANGGGGGNAHNGGGGGGGNHTFGGTGGQGYQPGGGCSTLNGGGVGGKNVNYSTLTSKAFLGGGGGAGQQNNGLASSGGRGGGIMLIRAKNVKSSCGGTYGFIADGQTASDNSGGDGAGGGGGGGVVILDVTNYVLTCNIFARANGGNGGNVTDGTVHGGGAGGGVGIIMETNPTTNARVTLSSTIGTTGRDCSSCTTNTATAAGTPSSSKMAIPALPGTGVIALPVKFLYFDATRESNGVQLRWATATEENNAYFVVQRSADGVKYDSVLSVEGVGNSSSKVAYEALDDQVRGDFAYYRLKQVDLDGKSTYSKILYITWPHQDDANKSSVYPNPAEGWITIASTPSVEKTIRILTEQGREVYRTTTTEAKTAVDVSEWSNGIYLVEVGSGATRETIKLVVKH